MLRNYIKVTFRNALKNKTYSLINIVGLAVGLAASIMMLVYVHFELSFDSFHTNKAAIYRVAMMGQGYSGGGIAKIYTGAGKVFKDRIPEVSKMARLAYFGGSVFKIGDQNVAENNGYNTDPDFFDMFDFKIIRGAKPTFDKPNTIVLSQSLATKYFADSDPIGESILISNGTYVEEPFEVVAIMEDTPANSHVDFDFLTPMENHTISDPNDWQRNQGYTYLMLAEGANPEKVEKSVLHVVLESSSSFLENYNSLTDAQRAAAKPFVLQSLPEIYLHSKLFREIGPTGDMLYVYIVSSLAVFVLIIAAINFINLSTARAASRAKEVGVRKANGAAKSELVSQFIAESVVFSLLSLIIATGLVELCLPYFNQEISQNLFLDYKAFLPWMIIGSILVGALAGLYPAFYLSSFQAARVLKDVVKFSAKSRLRQTLVVFQFTLSIALILASLIIFQQVDFMKNKDLGFDQEQIINLSTNSQALRTKYKALTVELNNHPNILNVSFSGNTPGGGDWGLPFIFEDFDAQTQPGFRVLEVDHNFVETYGMQIVEGRNFSDDIASDITGAYIINEEGARQLGWEDPVGKKVTGPESLGWTGNIIGVVKDFNFRSLHEPINPIVLFMNPDWSGTYSIKLGGGNFDETINFIESTVATFDPNEPFSFTFFDERIDKLYRSEEQLQFIVRAFTFLTILIAGIGLFGLASYAVVSRTKEFGIRKILGASVNSVIGILSSDFLKLIIIAFVIASPLAIIGMSGWLDNFAYKVNISPLIFIMTLLGVTAFAMLTILFQALKAGRVNPVDSLRYE
ncbi:MAG: ABC transporter permease [Cyclobacteriaceae bacterium]